MMRGRNFYITLCLLASVFYLHAASDNQQPNVIYILADDLGYGDIQHLNPKGKIPTPNLDKLAKNGITFRDAHSGSSVCTPTRYGIITGRYCWRSRLKKGVLFGTDKHLIPDQRLSVADILKEKGYHTAMIGKWHLGWDYKKKGNEIDFSAPVKNGPDIQGFDYYYGICGSLDMNPYVYVENGTITAEPDRITENGQSKPFWRRGQTGSDFKHIDVLPNFVRRAVKHIENRSKSKQPFFLYLPLPAPHTPILPTKAFQGKSKTNAYGDFVMQVDHHVGELMSTLKKHNSFKNTLVFFTADNGCSPRADFKELKKVGHNPSHHFRGFKADIYEGGHRVPFIAHWPGRIKARQVNDSTICLTDLMATLADLLDIKLPDHSGEDSVSILPLLLGKKHKKKQREAIVHHSINGSFAIRKEDWKLILAPGSGGWSSPETAQAYKSKLPLIQLYNLKNDPSERKNLVFKNVAKFKELIQLLEKIIKNGRSTNGKAQKNDGNVNYLPKGFAEFIKKLDT